MFEQLQAEPESRFRSLSGVETLDRLPSHMLAGEVAKPSSCLSRSCSIQSARRLKAERHLSCDQLINHVFDPAMPNMAFGPNANEACGAKFAILLD